MKENRSHENKFGPIILANQIWQRKVHVDPKQSQNSFKTMKMLRLLRRYTKQVNNQISTHTHILLFLLFSRKICIFYTLSYVFATFFFSVQSQIRNLRKLLYCECGNPTIYLRSLNMHPKHASGRAVKNPLIC